MKDIYLYYHVVKERGENSRIVPQIGENVVVRGKGNVQVYGFTFLLGSLFCFESYFRRYETSWLLLGVSRAPCNTVLLSLPSMLLLW